MTRYASAVVIVVLSTIVIAGLFAGPPVPEDQRSLELAQQIRCPQCQVSVADSNAQVAQTMRTIIDEQIADGRSDDEILDYFVGRYGEWVLTRPPLGGSTLLLWLLPVAAVAAGGWAILRFSRTEVHT